MAPMSGIDYSIVVLYLIGSLALGAFVSTQIKGFRDYFLAGGALTTPLLVCTLVSSYNGIDITFGTSESGFYYGVVSWWWYSLPYYVFIALAAFVVAPRLSRFEGAMTLSDILESAYGTPTRVIGAAACCIYSIPVHSMAGMMALAAYVGLSPTWSFVVAFGVCAIYTVMGGMWADVLSDTVHFVLMCVSVAIAIPMAIDWVGGWSFVEHLPTDDVTGEPVFLQHHGGLNPWMLVAWATTGLTILIEPAFYQRVFAAEDKRSVQRALLVGILLWAAYDWGVTLIGMLARAAVTQGLLPDDLEGRSALLTLCVEMLPVGLRGLMIGGIVSAAMANVDTYSLLASANVVYDIYRPVADPQASDRRLLFLTRLGVFLVMVLAAALSVMFERMRDIWQFLASIMVSVLLVPLMAALFARPRPAAGLLASVAGFAGLIAFYGYLFTQGQYMPNEEVYMVQVGPVAVWQDYAALCALPVSLAGFVLGHFLGRRGVR
jgi:SSS family solute:Na+ symporter